MHVNKLEKMIEIYCSEVRSQIYILENSTVPVEVKKKVRDWLKHGMERFSETITHEDIKQIQQRIPNSTIDHSISDVEVKYQEALYHIKEDSDDVTAKKKIVKRYIDDPELACCLKDGDSDGCYELVEESDWDVDSKYQTMCYIYRCTETNTYWKLDVTRSGSPFTEWHYEFDEDYIDGKKVLCLTQVEKVQKVEIVTKWV